LITNCGLTTKKKGGTMNHPSGTDILALLIKLLEEQEKVKIKYTIEKGEQHG